MPQAPLEPPHAPPDLSVQPGSSTISGGRAAVLAGMLLLIMSGGLTYRTIRDDWADKQRAEQARDEQRQAEALLSTLKDAETGQRGYLLTGDQSYLQPYATAKSRLATNLEQVEQASADNRFGTQPEVQLRTLIELKMAELGRTVALRQAGQAEAALAVVREGTGKRLMDLIRDRIDAIRAAGDLQLAAPQTLARTFDRRFWPFSAAVLASLLLGGLTQEWRRKRRAAAAHLADRESFTRAFGLTSFMLRDVAGRITFWGSGMAALYGYTSETAVGQVSHALLSTIFPDALETIVSTVLANGEWYGELTHRCRDGAAKTVMSHWVLHRDSVDGHVSIIEMNFDINAMRRSDTVLRTIMDTLPGPIYAKDCAGKFLIANAAALTLIGKSWEEVAGRTDLDALDDPVQAAAVMAHDRRIMARGEVETLEEQVGEDHGQVRTWLSTKMPMLAPNGTIIGLAGLSVEITEQKRYAARQVLLIADLEGLSRQLEQARAVAERANSAKSRFLAGMSHELRTPLNGIIGYAHLMQIEGGLSEAQEARVNAMLASGQHLIEMITSVLDLSQIETGQMTLRAVQSDPKAIAASCLDLVRPLADAKSLTLRLAAAPDLPDTIALDPTRLRQVLLNLLGNAVKFTGEGGVTVCLERGAAASTFRIEIADTGRGIAADQRRHLFQDFERLGVQASSNVEGAGLGLALSSRIAALMGGTLGYSENPGGGSIFRLELPLNEAADALPETAPKRVNSTTHAKRQLNVLLVDDVAMNREIAAAFLQKSDFAVTCAASGAQAVAAAANTDFDVILMDVRMPDMDGLEATRRIRQIEGERGRVPIVALTAQAFTEQITECLDAGMDSHLAKPFTPDTLRIVVLQALETGRQHRPSHPHAAMPASLLLHPA